MTLLKHSLFKGAVAATLMVAAVPLTAQVKVIDSQPVTSASRTATASAPAPDNTAAQMFSRMQMLEQEVLELRGLVEQQAFEIKRLKQQRLDDYTDLDSRIAYLSTGGVAAPANEAGSVSQVGSAVNPSSQAVGAAEEPPNERQLYSDALNLLLKKKDFSGAYTKLEQYLSFFPEGLFAPNAFYWLGEINLSEGRLDEAKQQFNRLLERFPGHSKVPDAQFKLGKIYLEQGNTAMAKTLLTKVANSSSAAAQLAKDFLQANAL